MYKGENMIITKLSTENLSKNCITDAKNPRFSFTYETDKPESTLKRAKITANGWSVETAEQILVPYNGAALKPYSTYKVTVEAEDNHGDTAFAEMSFETGKMDDPWQAKWISDPNYKFTEKGVSPKPMTFRKKFEVKKGLTRAVVYSTALGVYEITLNNRKVGTDYFAPGFTSYKTNLQYQVYDVTDSVKDSNELIVDVAGGWAVGSFVFTRKNRYVADRQALLLELRLEYEDGSVETIITDESWDVSEDGRYRMADLYDGETYDATVNLDKITWNKAAIEKLRINPAITATYGSLTEAHEEFKPISINKIGDEIIYDFGQNFAGVIKLKINGKKGQIITVKHAEILNGDGTLCTAILRSAKATATYTCVDGEQEYSPKLTYMGFRYASVTGIDEKDVEVSALALYSDVEENGSFECSNEMINQLQSNIKWSSKSNFVDIPTDCPQRDERMGWTGDIAVFANTACYNFDMSRFLEKWLVDVKNEQLKTGGIPNTVPIHLYGFPATMPKMAQAFWGDACILVPWAEYLARGDKELLVKMYPTMKKYVKACKFWASLGVGKYRYIWHTPALFNFGDWVAPDEPTMAGWQKRSKWTATASLVNTSAHLSKIAEILGEKEDAKYYKELSEKVADAYVSVFTDGNGKLKQEFQTAYVLPLQFKMFPEEVMPKALKNLRELVKKNDYCIGTGFPGTPYILFALADNGDEETAFKMLTNTKCPSWLYEVKAGATTIWERYDALKEDGSNNFGGEDGTGGMISFNHYAFGAVGDFLYRRVAGIEPIKAGYKRFRVKPLLGGELTYANAQVNTPYGKITSDWKIENGAFTLKVTVPASTMCEVTLPDGQITSIGSGEYEFTCTI